MRRIATLAVALAVLPSCARAEHKVKENSCILAINTADMKAEDDAQAAIFFIREFARKRPDIKFSSDARDRHVFYIEGEQSDSCATYSILFLGSSDKMFQDIIVRKLK